MTTRDPTSSDRSPSSTPESPSEGGRNIALTICQPNAELILRGEKPIENRTWRTRYRGRLFIHAGKSQSWMEPEDDEQYPGMAFGAIVGVGYLVACLSLQYPADPYNWPERWRHLADHPQANGPFCLVLENVRRFARPIPCRGAQGFWPLPSELLQEIANGE